VNVSHPSLGCTPVRSTRDFGLGRLRARPPLFVAPVRSTQDSAQPSEGLWFIWHRKLRSIFGSGNDKLRASGSFGGVRCGPVEIMGKGGCGPWGNVGFGLRAKEAFAECKCGPWDSMALVSAGRCGFHPHRFAGHGEVEVRNSASHVGLGRGCYAFLHETGHEIDWRGVVRVVFSFGTPYAGQEPDWF
jgi:hypothetical protein